MISGGIEFDGCGREMEKMTKHHTGLIPNHALLLHSLESPHTLFIISVSPTHLLPALRIVLSLAVHFCRGKAPVASSRAVQVYRRDAHPSRLERV